MSASSDAPYRTPTPAPIEMAWTTEDDARRGCDALVALLEREGARVDAIARLELGPATLALCDAEGETRVYVGWEIARRVNRLLEASPSERRLHRAGERSTRWMLLTPAEADALRARGEPVLAGPPPIAPWPRHRLLALGGGLAVLATIVTTMVMAGELLALGATLLFVVVGTLIGRRVAPEGASVARRALGRALVDGPVLIPVARLAWIGEHRLLAVTIAALALAAIMVALSRRMDRASAPDGG